MTDPTKRSISRRDFLRVVGVTAAGAVIGGCLPKNSPTPSVAATATTPAATALPSTTPPQAIASKAQVAIGQAKNYDRALIRQQIEAMMDSLGGLGDVVRPGAKVVIKTNLTSGHNFNPPAGFTATESYATHPEVVRAVGELVRDAGAGQIFIAEAVYDDISYQDWGYEEVAKDLNATLVDLNTIQPYKAFVEVSVPATPYVFEKLTFNVVLQEADTFISIGKMKCHYNAGITLSMKNLFGLLPFRQYRENNSDWWRSSLHSGETKSRLPRIIVDINRARPIHLAVIDGVMTGEGGEVPRGTFKPVQPGVLVAGKNPVATDAVAAAVMSFDPTIEPPYAPFLRGDNYLNLAANLGLGTNRLEEIEVLGAQINDVIYPFNPAHSMG